MRGIRCRLSQARDWAGITPAHAGNTKFTSHSSLNCWDHPRACGEYCAVANDSGADLGSPPRMRGILTTFLESIHPTGITPAHAGNTVPKQDGAYASSGSPPRMRGIRYTFVNTAPVTRITPAHAGNTCLHPCPKVCVGDHPRACGEYGLAQAETRISAGSPPRMRGILP